LKSPSFASFAHIALFLALVVAFVSGCGGGTTRTVTVTAEDITPSTRAEWTTIETFSGGGNQQTANFEIPAGEVRVVWHLSDLTSAFIEGADGFPHVFVQPTRDTPRDGETRLHVDPGLYYLSVESVGTWRFDFQQTS
jgi:hypothetical protein